MEPVGRLSFLLFTQQVKVSQFLIGLTKLFVENMLL